MLKFGIKNALFGYFWGRISKNYSLIWNRNPQICLIAKNYKETKMSKFGTKNHWFEYFLTGVWKQYCQIWNQYPQVCLIPNFAKKEKCLNVRAKLPNLDAFENFLTFLGIFEISTHKFVYFQNFTKEKKEKCLNLRSNVLYLGSFGLEF